MGVTNCPETPRQKMIGMMYLFLTAMLALNVSKEILNAFAIVDEGLVKTNKNFTDKNDYMYGALSKAKALDPIKAGPYYDAALKIKNLCLGMDKYVARIKDTLIKVVGKNNRPDTLSVRQIENKENYDIGTNLLVGNKEDGSEGEARKLRDKLVVLKSDIFAILKDPKIVIADKDKQLKDLADLGIDTKDPAGSLDKPEERYWETSKFYNTPLAGTITMLSQIQNQVKNAEATVVNLLLSSISATDFKFDTIAPKVIPKSTYVVSGDRYEADLFIAAFSTTENPKIYIGQGYDSTKGVLTGRIDSIPVSKGVGRYEVSAGGIGVQRYSAIIKVKNPVTGVYKSYPVKVNGKTDIEYIVAKPQAVISPTNMLVLYIGVDNPIDISASGYPDELVSASISDGTLKQTSKGKFLANVTHQGKVKINVSVKDAKGSKLIGTQEFRVKPVPNPVAKIANSKGGQIAKNLLMAQSGIKADMEGFEFDLGTNKFLVSGFKVSAIGKGGYSEDVICNGPLFNSQVVSLIKGLTRGQRVTFSDIYAKGLGSTRDIGSISFKIE